MRYFKIQKTAAEKIGYLQLSESVAVDLTAGLLKDGNYVIDEQTLDLIKANRALIESKTNRFKPLFDLDKEDIRNERLEENEAKLQSKEGK